MFALTSAVAAQPTSYAADAYPTTSALNGMIQPGTPDGVPPEFDCAMRAFAYEVGKAKLPERGDFRSLFESLQLQYCNMTTPAKMDGWVPPVAAPPAEGPTTVFVATDGDDAKGSGSKAAPFATLQKALSSLEGKGCASSATCTVAVRGGTYELAAPVEIGAAHSGITIENYNGEHATVSGGVAFTVPKAAWSPYKQKRGWELSAGANNVFGQAASKGDTDTIKYLGQFTTTADCEAAAKADAKGQGPFHSFTFHTPAFGGEFAGQCFGRTDRAWSPTAQPKVDSGRLVVQNTWVASVDGIGALADVKEFVGLRVDGRRAIRAKYPNGDPEQSGHFLRGAGASMGGGDYVEGWVPLSAGTEWVPPFRKPDAQEIVITADDWPSVEWPMTEEGGGTGATWTGEGDWGEYHLGMGGYCDDLDPPYGYWCAMAPPRGQCWDKKTNHGDGCTQTHMSPDGMVIPRAANYTNVEDAVVQSWRGGGRWFTQQWAVKEFVKENATLLFDPTTGMQGGEGMTASGQWWIENVLEECDDAREYFFDKRTRKLYFNPNATAAASVAEMAGPSGAENWVAARTRVLFNVSGTMAAPVVGVTIRGLSLRDTRYTYLDRHGMPSGGDWALQRSGAVTLEGTEKVAVVDCELTNIDGNGISINGYHRSLVIDHNDFSWVGDSAIASWGHTGTCLNENCSKTVPYKVGPDGRGGEQPRGTLISRNLVREIGIWQKQSSFYFQAVAAQTVVRDNVHFNGPRAGINLNDGFGGGDVLEGNLIANCVRESGDHGPFNSWDRVPYITTIATGKPSVVPAYRTITRNFIISTYSSQEAIDTDDGSSYYNTHDNFFVYAANGLKSDFGGQHNRHFRNVYAWTTDCWGGGNSDWFVNNTCVANSDTAGFRSDCDKAHGGDAWPLMEVSGNTIYNKAGTWTAKVCDQTNVLAGKWPDAAAVVEMGRKVLGFPGAAGAPVEASA